MCFDYKTLVVDVIAYKVPVTLSLLDKSNSESGAVLT